jgi:hypothetical protein
MPDHESPPSLISELCALTRDQLKTQTTRSVALEASALGVMAFDATFATIALTFGRTRLWIAVLALLCMSFAPAIVTLGLPGADQAGPASARIRRRRESEDDALLTERLLDWLERDRHVNLLILKRKEPLRDRALIFLALAVIIELAGVVR